MKKNKTLYLVLLVIMGAGLLVRLWGILQGGFAFTYDTGRDLLAIRDLVTGAKFSLIGPTSGQMGVFYGPWYYWILAIPFILSGGNPAFIVSFIAVMGVAAAVIAYWWGRRFSGDIFALVFSAMLAISPVFIGATTQLWSPDLIVPVMVAILILWSRLATLSGIGLVGLGFLLGFLDELEIVYGVVFVFAFLASIFVWQRKLFWSKKTLHIVAGIVITEIPRVVFELRHGLLQTKIFFGLVAGRATSSPTLQKILQRADFLWDHVTELLPGGDLMKLAFIAAIAAMIVFQWNHIAKTRRVFVLELLTASGVFLLFMLLYGQDVWPYYLIGLPVILSFFVALAVSLLRRLVQFSVLATLVFMLLFFVGKPVEFVTSMRNPFVGDAALFRNQIEVMQYIYKEAGSSDFNLIAYTPPQIEYTWRYLSWWTKRSRQRGEVREKQSMLFVIIEPDYGYPERVRNWIASRKDDGEVIKQIMFNSGIIVQTRKREVDI